MSQDPKSKLSSTGMDFTKKIHSDTYDFIRPEQFDLRGEAVLVTGASRGFGRAAAIGFAKAGASYIALGARTSLADVERDIQEAAKAAGRKTPHVLSLKLDVSDEGSVKNAVAEVEKAFARLDILCNNAGYLEKWFKVGESDADEWWKTWEVNVRGVYLCARGFLPLMLKGGMKTILNTSSIGGNAIMAGSSGYQTGKLAVMRFSEFLDTEYRDEGVLSFAINPGAVMTKLNDNLPEYIHGYLTDTPELGGDAMVWLTAERREWLAGRYVSATWDMQELLEKRQKIVDGDLLKVRLDVGLE